MFNELYKKVITKNPDINLRKHYGRVNKRLIELSKDSEVFNDIIDYKTLIINGKKYRNINECMKILCERSALIKEMAPKELRMIHGDLHFKIFL